MASGLQSENTGAVMPTRATSTPMQVIFRFIGERKGLFTANLGLRVIKDLLPFANPILIGWTIDLLSGTNVSAFGYDLFPNDLRSLYIVAGLMAALAVAKMIFGYVHTIVAAHMGRHVVEAARRDLSEASMQMALDERRRFNSGDLLDRSLADSKGLRSFTQNVIIRVISNTLRAIWPVIFLFVVDWVMALVVMSVIPLQSGLSALLQRRLQRLTRESRQAEATHTSGVKEAIDGWSSVASVGGQDWVTAELRRTASASEDAKIRKKHTTAAISAVISLFTALGIAACYAIGGWRIISEGAVGAPSSADLFTVGDLVAFIGIAKKVYAPFQAYTKIVSSYRTGLVNLERIAEVLDAPVLDPRNDGPDLQITNGDLQLDGVGFGYDGADEPTLRSLTGRIPGRTLTVITGSSGTGKTTLLRLIMGLDQPHAGTISIDGQDINVARLASVQQTMALVPQEPMLFTGTLEENLTLGRVNTTAEEMLDACHKAGLLDLVRELPEGLDTEVGSGRHMLSGGQLRRMAIARALLRRPQILLLDEPTTGLDKLNSKQVLDTLRRIAQSATVIMVSHRRDPLEASDHHLVLDGGMWRDGDGQGDRWRPEFTGTLTEQATLDGGGTEVPEPMSSGTTVDPAVTTIGANGAAGNGHATGHQANGHIANGRSTPKGRPGPTPPHAPLDEHVLGLSAMGRTIAMRCRDKADATSRVLVVGNHRSTAAIDPQVVGEVLARSANDDTTHVAVAGIADANPDGAYTDDRRSVLGVDLVADHTQRLAGETTLLQRAIEIWQAVVMIDIGERQTAHRTNADVEIVIRHDAGPDGAPDWLAQLGSDIRRRLKASRFSVSVALAEADSSSITRTTGVPVIEVTAISPPHTAGSDRSALAVIEAAQAAYEATGLLRPAIAL